VERLRLYRRGQEHDASTPAADNLRQSIR